jgi:hypothetical protein
MMFVLATGEVLGLAAGEVRCWCCCWELVTGKVLEQAAGDI